MKKSPLFEYFVCPCGSSGPPRWIGPNKQANSCNYGVLIGGTVEIVSENGSLWITTSYKDGEFFCYSCGNVLGLKQFVAPETWIGAYL
jgi:hypothetical protein